MLVQTGLGGVGVGAFVSVVGLLLAMYPDHVLFEVDTLCELVLTQVAGERLLQLVHALVGFPNVLVRELLVTELARVEVLPDVDVSVHPHVVAGCVVLSTLNANVTLLTTGT